MKSFSLRLAVIYGFLLSHRSNCFSFFVYNFVFVLLSSKIIANDYALSSLLRISFTILLLTLNYNW